MSTDAFVVARYTKNNALYEKKSQTYFKILSKPFKII